MNARILLAASFAAAAELIGAAQAQTFPSRPLCGTPEQFGAFLQSESARYAKAVREAGVRVD